MAHYTTPSLRLTARCKSAGLIAVKNGSGATVASRGGARFSGDELRRPLRSGLARIVLSGLRQGGIPGMARDELRALQRGEIVSPNQQLALLCALAVVFRIPRLIERWKAPLLRGAGWVFTAEVGPGSLSGASRSILSRYSALWGYLARFSS